MQEENTPQHPQDNSEENQLSVTPETIEETQLEVTETPEVVVSEE